MSRSLTMNEQNDYAELFSFGVEMNNLNVKENMFSNLPPHPNPRAGKPRQAS